MFRSKPVSGIPGGELDEGWSWLENLRAASDKSSVERVQATCRPELPHAHRGGTWSREVRIGAEEDANGVIWVGDGSPGRGGSRGGGSEGRAPGGWKGGEDEVEISKGVERHGRLGAGKISGGKHHVQSVSEARSEPFFFWELEQLTILGTAKRNQPTKDKGQETKNRTKTVNDCHGGREVIKGHAEWGLLQQSPPPPMSLLPHHHPPLLTVTVLPHHPSAPSVIMI